MDSKDIESQIFNKDNLSVRERVTDWAPEFRKVVGSRVFGKYSGYWIKPAEGRFKEQLYVAIEDNNDSNKVTAVQVPSYRLDEVRGYQTDDLVGIEYAGDKPSKEKGLNPTKIINVYNSAYQSRVASGSVVKSEMNVESGSVNGDVVSNTMSDFEATGTDEVEF